MIEALRDQNEFSLREICTALEVPISTFYAHQHKPQKFRRQEDQQISQAMKEVFEGGRGAYGSPRLVRGLRTRGIRCGKTRIRRLMRQEGLCARQKRRSRPRTTQSNPHLPVTPNLALEAKPPTAPGQSWKSDITYIPTAEGFLYLAVTLDAFSRKCAGWAARDTMETPLVLDAAQMAFSQATPGADQPLHHSDRGSQYASERFRALLEEESILQSMSRRGNCYDNAMMESFWGTLKTECFDNFRDGIPGSRQEAKTALFDYIELFYNRERIHSALDYTSPLQFEQNWTQQHFTVQAST